MPGVNVFSNSWRVSGIVGIMIFSEMLLLPDTSAQFQFGKSNSNFRREMGGDGYGILDIFWRQVKQLSFATGFFLLLASTTLARQPYNFYSLRIEDGLAHHNVYAVYQDKSGYIWFGAGTRLQRYDGTRFLTYEHEKGNPNSLPHGNIRTILEDRNGALWIGTDGGGLARLEDGKIESITSVENVGQLKDFTIDEIIELPDGTLCMAAWRGGVLFYKEGVFTQLKYDPNDSNTISDNNVGAVFFDDVTNRLWVGTWGGGLCYVEEGKVHRVPISTEGFDSDKARTITKTSDGAIWIGSWEDGLFCYKDGHFSHYDVRSGALENNNVLTLTAQGEKLWIGTWGGGVTLYEKGKFTTYRHSSSLDNTIASDNIESSMIDNEGNLWVGTYGGGVTKFEKAQFAFVDDISDGRMGVSKFIRSIAEDAMGRVWIAGVAGVYVLDGASFQPVSTLYPQMSGIGSSNALYKARNGDIWIGGNTGVGLFQFDGERLIDRSVWNNVDFRDYFIHKIMQSKDGSIWICSDVNAGLNRIKGDTVIRYFHDPSDEHSISSDNLYSAIEASDGSIWVCASHYGINVFRDGQFTRYRANDSDPKALSNDYVYSLLETNNGDIWIASEEGLNRYDPEIDGFEHFYKSHGLGDNTILSLLEDVQGNIWMGTHSGISKLNPKTMSFQNFDYRSGVKGYPFHRGVIHQSSQTKEIFVGGVNGLLIFHPDTVKQYNSLPTARITNVLVNNRPVLPESSNDFQEYQEGSSLLIVKPFKGSLAFEYSDMNFGSGEEVQYSYRVRELEAEWNAAGNNFIARYSKLPPGDYVFQIRTSLDGVEWGASNSLKFRILPYWWETIWFKVMVVLCIIGFVLLLVFLRLRLVERQRMRLERLVNEKTEEIHLKNDQIVQKSEELSRTNGVLKKTLLQVKDLQNQQVIFQENERQTISRELHDSISSALFGIRMMVSRSIEEDREGDVMVKVPVMIDELIGQVIRDSQIILNNLSTSFNKHTSFFDSLNDLVTQSKQICRTKIHLDWKGSAHIQELRIGAHVFRIIQEALANAMKHANAQNIYISFDNGESLRCAIVDDGIGFEADDPEIERYGLQNIRNRAREISGKLEIRSLIGGGTSIVLEMER